MSAVELVDAFLAKRRIRSDAWDREELLILANGYRELGPKAIARWLPKRTHRAAEEMARRLGLAQGLPIGPRVRSS